MIAGTTNERFDSTDLQKELIDRIVGRTARVGVVGLGYVGLPLAREFVRAGFAVVGVDVDVVRVDMLKRGRSYLAHFSSGDVGRMLEEGFEATSDGEVLAGVDVVVVCVPTPLTESREPDLSYVVRAGEMCADWLRPGQLVVLESTTYPGTTRRVFGPILERTGLRVGRDFFLGYSPEREDPGNADVRTAWIPKVVAGIDRASAKVARLMYESAFEEVVPVGSVEVAEGCKLLENTYRAVNIGLVNELKVLFDRLGLDLWEVIEAAKTKPFGFEAFYPGPGVGGHCIPVDPQFLAWLARRVGGSARFVELASEVNEGMPRYVLGRIVDALNERGKAVRGSSVLLLGIGYKRGVDDTRLSPARPLMGLLAERGASVRYCDPYVRELPRGWRLDGVEPTSRALTAGELAGADAVVVVTDHDGFDWGWIVEHSSLVIDTRNSTRGLGSEKVVYS